MTSFLAIAGFLEWIFVGVLTALVGLAVVFLLFLVFQQFRNPSRRGPSSPR